MKRVYFRKKGSGLWLENIIQNNNINKFRASLEIGWETDHKSNSRRGRDVLIIGRKWRVKDMCGGYCVYFIL